MFVCSDMEAKLLDGSQPNLAWAIHWYLCVTLKYFFGLTPLGGYNFRKTQKIQTFSIWPRTKGGILLRHLNNGLVGFLGLQAKRPAPSQYITKCSQNIPAQATFPGMTKQPNCQPSSSYPFLARTIFPRTIVADKKYIVFTVQCAVIKPSCGYFP